MNKKILAGIGLIFALTLMGNGCAQMSQEAQDIQENQNRLATAVPLPQLDNSLERLNISKRLSMFDDPNKVSYIYLINYGKVMAFYTIKGKVTSGGKRLTSNQQPYDWVDKWGKTRSALKDAPELDGTYGSSAPYIFFWTTDDVYVQWSGDYMEVDQPLQLSTPPEMVRSIK